MGTKQTLAAPSKAETSVLDSLPRQALLQALQKVRLEISPSGCRAT